MAPEHDGAVEAALRLWDHAERANSFQHFIADQAFCLRNGPSYDLALYAITPMIRVAPANGGDGGQVDIDTSEKSMVENGRIRMTPAAAFTMATNVLLALAAANDLDENRIAEIRRIVALADLEPDITQ